MDDSNSIKIFLIVVALLFSAFFSGSEAGFLSIQRGKLEHLVRNRVKRADRVDELAKKPEKLLPTVLTGNNLANTAAAVLGTSVATSYFSPNTALLVATVGITLLLLVFCETIPKTVAAKKSEQIAFLAVIPLRIIELLLFPAVWLLQRISNLVAKTLNVSKSDSITEEEIRALILTGGDEGALEPQEAEMLERVFHFGDHQINEVTTPRHDVIWIPIKTTRNEFLDIYSSYPYSRFPVCTTDMDSVVGVLSVKDVIRGIARNDIEPDESISKYCREPLFVPENKRVSELLQEFQHFKYSMAIAVDELGISNGVVTLHDLLEVVMGPLEDYDGIVEEKDIALVDEQKFEIKGNTSIEEINRTLGISIPEGDYNSIAGLLLDYLGHIPTETETLTLDDITITVAHVRGVKIERVLLSIQAPTNSNVI